MSIPFNSDVDINGDLFVTGRIDSTSLGVDGPASVGNLDVFGDLSATGHITIGDAKNIILNTSNGTKIGTATNQKLGFFNSTPVVQPGATTDLGTVLSNLGLRVAGTAYPISTTGDTALSGNFDLIRDWGSVAPTNLIATFTSYNDGGRVVIRRAKGSLASPTQLLADDSLGNFNFRGYHSGGAFATGGTAAITAIAEEDFTSSAQGTRLVFNTAAIGGTTAPEKMRLSGSGRLIIGSATEPNALLEVNGSSNIIQTIIQGHSTQTANLTEWQNSSGTVLLRVQPDGDLEFTANNIVTDTTTGTKIGTATNQKLGFYNSTPIVQPSAYTQTYSTASKTITQTTMTDPATYGAGANGYSTAAMAQAIHAEVIALRANMIVTQNVLNQVIDDLQALGLLS